MNEWVAVLRDFGFPVAVAAFLLVRGDRTINRGAAALERLADVAEKWLASGGSR